MTKFFGNRSPLPVGEGLRGEGEKEEEKNYKIFDGITRNYRLKKFLNIVNLCKLLWKIYLQLLWQKNYGGNSRDIFNDVIAVEGNGFILCGSSESSNGDVEKNAGGYDYWIVKILPTGEIEWQKSYGGPGNDVLRAVIPFANGYFLAGYSDSNAGFEK